MEDLRIMKNDELRDIARSYAIIGAWKMNKNQLIDSIIKAANFNGHVDMYFDSEAQNEPEQLQIAPESTESDELNNLSDKSEEAVERNSNDDYTIAAKDSNGGLSIIAEVHHENIAQELQSEPEPASESKDNKLYSEEEADLKMQSEANSNNALKEYGAWVKDRITKELTTVVGKAESREAFYLSIKDKYRVRLITKPEKLEEECKEWEIRHARNKKMKNEKYATDKAKAKELGMSVAKYRKEVKNK